MHLPDLLMGTNSTPINYINVLNFLSSRIMEINVDQHLRDRVSLTVEL